MNDKKLEVLYRDEFLLAVNKPPGLLSVPGRGPDKADCAVARAALDYGWIREVHRLDMATSGVLLMARNPDVHRKLSKAFADREVEKTYIAITHALPGDPHKKGVVFEAVFEKGQSAGRITLFQRLDTDNRPHQILDPERGKEAVTDWRRLHDIHNTPVMDSAGAGIFRLELKPLTGRTHQLRLALSECGASILGDSLYGEQKIRNLSSRLLLHAAFLGFIHPVNGESLEIKAVIPF